MRTIIREMTDEDRGEVFEMMKVFYASPAVSTNGSAQVFQADIDHCVGDCPYLEGYIPGRAGDSGLWDGGEKLFHGVREMLHLD